MGVLQTEQREQIARAEAREARRGVVVDKIRFDNRAQANQYVELQVLQRAGTISELKPHARVRLIVPGVNGNAWVDTYTATFSYKRDGKLILIDMEFETDLRWLQKRLVKALLGVQVTNV